MTTKRDEAFEDRRDPELEGDESLKSASPRKRQRVRLTREEMQAIGERKRDYERQSSDFESEFQNPVGGNTFPQTKRSFGDEEGYRPRKTYGDDEGYRPRETYGDDEGYRPRKSYGDDEGYRPRKSYGDDEGYGPRKTYGNRPRKTYGNDEGYRPRKTYGNDEGYHPRKTYGNDEGYHPRKTYGNDEGYRPRKTYGDDEGYRSRKTYGDNEGYRPRTNRYPNEGNDVPSYKDRFRSEYVGDQEARPRPNNRPNYNRNYNNPANNRTAGQSYNYNNGNNYGKSQSGPRKPYQPTKGFQQKGTDTKSNKGKKSPIFKQIKQAPHYSFEDEQDLGDAVRLNKFLAHAGIASRREADQLILAGAVVVNGVPVLELGTKVEPSDRIEVNGKVLTREDKVYILLNKPRNVVTTTDDPQERMTVLNLVKNASGERIYPVGRLDRNTTGVLLLTNDGDLAAKLVHPSFKKKKIYQVWLDKEVVPEDMQKLADGVDLSDGEMHADAISYVDDEDHTQVGIEIHSGKNRIVRRLFEALGYKVVKLDRVYFAGLTKKNLGRGKWRYLTEQEVIALKNGFFE